jgi:hypothetical protein
MSWENRKEWHIDHIRPMAAFKFTSTKDAGFRKCFALSNLQPLWAHENCMKDAWWSTLSKREQKMVGGKRADSRRKRPTSAGGPPVLRAP